MPIPQNVRDVHDSRGGVLDGYIVKYDSDFTDGFDSEDGVMYVLLDEGLDGVYFNDMDPSKFEIYRRV